jgi:hypothetical protein
MIIDRPLYLDKLIARKHNGLIKIVTGLRRCGKSFLLFELFRNHLLSEGVDPSHIIEIQLDGRDNAHLRDPDVCDAYVREKVRDGAYYVFIDEIQFMPEFSDVLNGFLHLGNADIYVTGSNSRFLSSDILTEFRGRGDEVRVHPLNFSEFHKARKGEWDEDWDDYITFGGMPQLFTMASEQDKMNYLKRLFTETYARDIIERNNIRNDLEFEELVDIIASDIGALTNPDKLAATFKSKRGGSLSAATIKRYLDCLEDAFLVNRANQYNIKGKRYISTPMKYYFEDIGVRNACMGFRQLEPTHMMENVVYNELLVRGYSVDVGAVDVMEAGKRKRLEIDFVATLGNRRYYIQSAYALPTPEKREQEERSLLSVKDAFKKIVVTTSSQKPHYDENGILIMGLKQFLLDSASLEY